MGDRTWIELSVLEQHEATVSNMIHEVGYRRIETEAKDGIVTFMLDDVNYAEIGIEPELQKQRLPYDKEWAAGCEYKAGTEYFRLRDGDGSLCKSVYDGDNKIDPNELLTIINDLDHKDSKYDRLASKIMTHIDYHAPLEPLIQQLQYAKESV